MYMEADLLISQANSPESTRLIAYERGDACDVGNDDKQTFAVCVIFGSLSMYIGLFPYT